MLSEEEITLQAHYSSNLHNFTPITPMVEGFKHLQGDVLAWKEFKGDNSCLFFAVYHVTHFHWQVLQSHEYPCLETNLKIAIVSRTLSSIT